MAARPEDSRAVAPAASEGADLAMAPLGSSVICGDRTKCPQIDRGLIIHLCRAKLDDFLLNSPLYQKSNPKMMN